MLRVDCPECRAQAAFAQGKPYCPQCGWNRGVAEQQLRKTVRAWPRTALIFLLITLALWAGLLHNGRVALWMVGVLATIFALMYVSIRRKLAQFLAQKSETSVTEREPSISAARLEAISSDVNRDYRVLLSLSRPRPVRLAQRGRFSAAVTIVIVLVLEAVFVVHLYFAWIAAGTLATLPERHGVATGLLLLLPLVLVGQRYGMVRQRELIAHGELAIAKVIRQWRSQNNYSIQYEFKDASGKTFQNTSSDYTHSLYEGMTVPVFYDPGRPGRQVAQCAAFYEVVLPGSE